MNNEAQKAVRVFQSGGIVVFPTDTAFGIGCRLDREDSVRRLFEIRKRPETKPMLALVSSIEMAKEFVTISEEVQSQIIAKYWPGALTVILPCNTEKIPGIVRANGSTLAVRM